VLLTLWITLLRVPDLSRHGKCPRLTAVWLRITTSFIALLSSTLVAISAWLHIYIASYTARGDIHTCNVRYLCMDIHICPCKGNFCMKLFQQQSSLKGNNKNTAFHANQGTKIAAMTISNGGSPDRCACPLTLCDTAIDMISVQVTQLLSSLLSPRGLPLGVLPDIPASLYLAWGTGHVLYHPTSDLNYIGHLNYIGDLNHILENSFNAPTCGL
jgi:hypothetical protein